MRQGKWYKVYYIPYERYTGRAQTMRVYAFSFASAIGTVKVKLSQIEKIQFDPEKILVTRVDYLGKK